MTIYYIEMEMTQADDASESRLSSSLNVYNRMCTPYTCSYLFDCVGDLTQNVQESLSEYLVHGKGVDNRYVKKAEHDVLVAKQKITTGHYEHSFQLNLV